MGALWQQESSMRTGAVGQQTPYGTPIGIGQMLPGTAQATAQSIGWPWRPDLYSGTTPEAANYQKGLSGAYLMQGYKATGNLRDAFKYYYGGPNRSMWGPKTNAYADQMMGRIGGF